MQSVVDTFKNHEVHAAIADTLEAIEQKDNVPDEQSTIYLNKAKAILIHVRLILGQTDPMLVPTAILKNLLTEVQGLKTHLDANQFGSLGSKYTLILKHIASVPVLKTPDGTEHFYTMLAVFEAKGKLILKEMEAEKEGLKKNLSKLHKKQDQEQQRLLAFEEEANNLKKRMDNVIGEFQKQFLDGSEKRNASFADTLKSFRDDIDQFKNGFKPQIDSITQELKNESETLIESIEKQKNEAARIVGIIAQTGTAGHYDRVANREWWTAEILRGFSALSVLGIFGFMAWAFYDVSKGTLPWESALLFRVSLGLPWLGLAIYLARESSRHRTNEMRNRQMSMELATVRPYLNDLPDEKKEALLEEFARGYFGKKQGDGDSDDDSSLQWPPIKGVSMNRLLRILERIANVAKDIKP